MAAGREWLGKHTSMATDMHTTLKLLEVVCSMRFVQRLYRKNRSVPACGCYETVTPGGGVGSPQTDPWARDCKANSQVFH